jgi:Co/Zn/Cd efflux system component
MKNFIDTALKDIFGGVWPLTNMVAGVLLIIVGIVILVIMRNKPSKGKKIAAQFCIGVGILGFICGLTGFILI